MQFLVHGAERTGPPIFLLRLLQQWATSPAAIDPRVVLARGGALQGEFSKVAPTSTAGLHRRSPERLVQRALGAAHLASAGSAVVAAATRRRVGSTRADLTVVNGATAPTAELLGALSPPGEVVLIAHELSTGWFENLAPPQRDLLLARTDRYLAVSRCVASFLHDDLAIPAERVTVTRPPVPPRIGRRRDETGRPYDGVRRCRPEVVIGGAGVHDWRKAPELWLQLAARLRDRVGPGQVKFVWFGGHERGAEPAWPIRHEVRALGLEDDVEFAGEVDDFVQRLDAVDVFVTTAREDAYPLVCAEAAAAGVPVVAFGGGGAEELVTDARCGRAVPYPDLDAMADAAVELAHDEPLRRRLGDNGRQFARDHFDPTSVAAHVERWLLRGAA